MNGKIDKYEFLYFLHGTEDESVETLEDIFNHGLKDEYGISIGSTMMQISTDNIDKLGLETMMKNYATGSFKSVFLIKIPKKYMGIVLHRDNKIDFPVPLFQKTGKKADYGREVYYFTPHLVQGVYNKTTDLFITNPNFSPIFDPSGLEYSNEQMNNFWGINQVQWVNYAKSRQKFSYQELYDIDKRQGIFKEYMDSYSKYFGVALVPKTTFMAISYRQKLQQEQLNEMLATNINQPYEVKK